MYSELGKGLTSEAAKYLFRASNMWWRCAQYFVIVARCLETIDVCIWSMFVFMFVYFNGFSASGQFDAAELIRYMITKPQRRQPDQTHLKLLQMSGDVHPNPGHATKYPCPVCTRNITSRGVSYKCTKCYGWVHAKCSGILNAAQHRRKS